MPNIFKPKRSSTASSVPTTGNLSDGEMAVNLADRKIYVRNGASIVTVADSLVDGDKGDVTVSSSGATWTIDSGVVTNAKLANVSTATIKGRTTAGSGSPEDLTGTQATALLDAFTSSAKGLAPASGGGTSNFLRADGTWTAPTFTVSGNLNVGIVTATSFVKSGGTSTQFLKADGSVDTNTYITSASVGNGTLTLGVSGTGLSGSASFTANQSGNTTFTVTSNATSANTVSAIVARDASGNFSAGTITATSFSGSLANTLTAGSYLTGTSYNNSSAVTFAVDATTAATASKVVARDSSGNIFANQVVGGTGSGISAAGLVVNGTTGDNDSQLIIKKPSQSAFSVLSWDGDTFISSNTYYENGVWIHSAPSLNTNSQLFDFKPGTGVLWYTSSNSSSSWNVSAGVTLWNDSGVWQRPLANTLTLNTSGTGISGSTTYNNSGAATFTVTSNATSANTVSTIVARDASGNFTAGTITATSFSGSLANTLTLNTSGTGLSGSTTFNNSGAATFTVTSNATSANTVSTIVARDASGNFTAGTITSSNLVVSGDGSTLYGPNTTWTQYLRVGGNGNADTTNASVVTTNGNLHLDSKTGAFAAYLNYYKGTSGVAFGNGASGIVAWMGPDGDLWKGGADNTGSAYWHAGNDGAGSGLDADLLDGLSSGSFLRSDTTTTWSGSAGGVFQITLPASASGSTATQVNTLQLYQSAVNTDSFLSFHVAGDYAVHFGLDGTTNDLFVGGWSLGAAKYRVWHANNDGSGSGLDADLLDGLNSATANTASTIVARDASGNFSAGTITASLSGSSTSCSGNAATATTLQTARSIGGTSFNGSADITPFRANTISVIDGGTLQASGATYAARSASSTPQQLTNGLHWEFKNAAVVGGAGNYAGLLTLAPWVGTTASTGDPTYQLAFSPAAANSTAIPTLQVRAGIDATWGSWATILNSSNYTSYVGNGTLTLAVSGTGLSGSASFTANQSGNTTFTVTSNATSANTVSAIVARDASGNFSAGTITATLSGNASSATTAAACSGNAATSTTFSTNRTNYSGVTNDAVAGQLMWKNYGNNHTLFDASAGTSPQGGAVDRFTPSNLVDSATGVNTWGYSINLMGWNGTSTYGVRVDYSRVASNLFGYSGTYWTSNNDGAGSGLDADLLDGLNSATANTASTIVARDASGNFSAGTITATLSGNASSASTAAACSGNSSTATTLQTTRTIWGQNFNGGANVSGALTGVTDITASGNIAADGAFRAESSDSTQRFDIYYNETTDSLDFDYLTV